MVMNCQKQVARYKYSYFDVYFVVYHFVHLEVFNFNSQPLIYTLYIYKNIFILI